MIPKPPPKEGGLGFLFIPPFRVQGTSIAGEATCIQVPELDICFDMGVCPRAALASKVVAVSHGHMDHIGGLAYYCSQRVFQGMGPGTILCPKAIGPAIRRMMEGYVALEEQVTPFNLVEMDETSEFEIKNNILVRSFPVEHTCPAAGYTVYERRSKLKPEYYELPQEKLRELKDQGVDITRILHVPLVSYVGDTCPGPWLIREDVRKSQVVIAECTFTEDDHRDRAVVGKHLHLRDIAEWLGVLECQKLVLIHLSRRSNILEARKSLRKLVKPQQADRVEFLMDYRENKTKYERQEYEALRAEAERTGAPMPPPPRPGGFGGRGGPPRSGPPRGGFRPGARSRP
ncbi:MAG: MBL fold metallo-hydrolase [Planctomycetota bacterium]|nr:MBL fold metallo-hydrolase [Planctomycetota bacterium]